MSGGLPSWMIAAEPRVDPAPSTSTMWLTAKRLIADGVVELDLEPDEGPVPRWERGRPRAGAGGWTCQRRCGRRGRWCRDRGNR